MVEIGIQVIGIECDGLLQIIHHIGLRVDIGVCQGAAHVSRGKIRVGRDGLVVGFYGVVVVAGQCAGFRRGRTTGRQNSDRIERPAASG